MAGDPGAAGCFVSGVNLMGGWRSGAEVNRAWAHPSSHLVRRTYTVVVQHLSDRITGFRAKQWQKLGKGTMVFPMPAADPSLGFSASDCIRTLDLRRISVPLGVILPGGTLQITPPL